jgi:hypothetical protein
MATVKCGNYQIWIFRFERFNIVHSLPQPHLKLSGLETWPSDAPMFRFSPFSRPIYKNMYGLYGSGPTTSVYLEFHLPWPAKFAVGFSSPGEWGPFEIYLPGT